MTDGLQVGDFVGAVNDCNDLGCVHRNIRSI